MDDRPRNLRAMLSEAKDLSELMVDLAYAALYFGDPDMAEEVGELEERMDALVHDMRSVCVMAARHPREADAMASVLQVISSIERIANSAVDIARIVTHRLGIPRELVADLSNAEEVSHRVRVRDGSHLARRPLADLELPVQTGMRIVAIRRDREWITDVEGEEIMLPGDVLFLRGSPAGIPRLRELAAAPQWEPPTPPEDGTLTDLDRAVDVLVEMKNVSETAVGLAYSALVLRDLGLAAEVRHLEDRLDEMKDRLELWVLRAASNDIDPSPLRGLLHLSQAAEDLGDSAQQMVWLIEKHEEVHPILKIALGESDEVVVRVPVAAGSPADGATLQELQLDVDPGFHVLAVRRGGRYIYRPRGHVDPGRRRRADRQRARRGPPPARRPPGLAPRGGRGHRRRAARAAGGHPRPLSPRRRDRLRIRSLWRPDPRRTRGSGVAGGSGGVAGGAGFTAGGVGRGGSPMRRGGAGRAGSGALGAGDASPAPSPLPPLPRSSSATAVSDPAMPASSVGTTILVAWPSAIAGSASRYLIVSSAVSGAASWMAPYTDVMAWASPSATVSWRNLSASATRWMAVAWPSARRICCCLSPSARRMAACWSPSARVMAACRSPSACGDHGPPGALGLHLLVHGVHDVGRRVDALDLDPADPHAPLVGGVVEDLAQLEVDLVAGGQRLVELHVADRRCAGWSAPAWSPPA